MTDLAVFRALMAGDYDAFQHLLAQLGRDIDGAGVGALLNCCFFEAVDRRFVRDGVIAGVAEVIDFVDDVRARSEPVAEDLDQRTAERIILCALGEGSLANIDGVTMSSSQFLILAALAADAQLDGPELDEFMAEVRALADDWTSRPPPGEEGDDDRDQ